MAWTISKQKTVFGNMRVHIMSCTADAATQNIETGLSKVYGHSLSPISMATAQSYSLWSNSGAAGTSLAGILGASGFASGDEMYITVYGT